MSPDSVVLDVFFVRFPFGDEGTNGPLWEAVDEQHFPSEVRRELVRNGFRLGLVGTQLPTALSELLEMTDQAPAGLETSQTRVEELSSAPKVTGWHSQCQAGNPVRIEASDVYDELPVLMSEECGLCGRTYAKAQGMLAITPYQEPDGRVRLEVVPELHYGAPRQRPVVVQGGFRLEVDRRRQAFDELAFEATLSPGHMIVISSLPNRPGSLGHHFLTQVDSGRKEQKLLVIRLSQTQHDGLFVPTKVIALDEAGE